MYIHIDSLQIKIRQPNSYCIICEPNANKRKRWKCISLVCVCVPLSLENTIGLGRDWSINDQGYNDLPQKT